MLEIKYPNGVVIHLDEKLKRKLDNALALVKKNWDMVILIDGLERSGKTTLGFTCATYLTQGRFTHKQICSGIKDTPSKIENAKQGDLLFEDESELAFSSKDAMRQEQRDLIKIMNIVGQKGLIFILILPSFFELAKYIATHRSRFLLHVYTDKQMNRGRFAYFGTKRKKMLYEIGKKNFNSYSKPKSNFIGRFYDFRPSWNDEYMKIKGRSLMEAFETAKNPIRTTTKDCWLKVINNLEKAKPPLTTSQKAQIIGMARQSINRYERELELGTKNKTNVLTTIEEVNPEMEGAEE